jgi:NADH-quinone oxidoreductase subunit C/D
MREPADILTELQLRFPQAGLSLQPTCDGVPAVWTPPDQVGEVLRYLKSEAPKPYRMLYDLYAIDERERTHRAGQPESDFTVVYHLLSFDRNADV